MIGVSERRRRLPRPSGNPSQVILSAVVIGNGREVHSPSPCNNIRTSHPYQPKIHMKRQVLYDTLLQVHRYEREMAAKGTTPAMSTYDTSTKGKLLFQWTFRIDLYIQILRATQDTRMRTSEASRCYRSTPNAMVGAHAKPESNNATCCVPNGIVVLRRAAMSAREVIAPSSICVKESKAWKTSIRHTSALRHAGSAPAGSDDGECLGSIRSMSKASKRYPTYVGTEE